MSDKLERIVASDPLLKAVRECVTKQLSKLNFSSSVREELEEDLLIFGEAYVRLKIERVDPKSIVISKE